MKQPITFRLDAGLLAEARERAVRENRTLTNYLETVLKIHLADPRSDAISSAAKKTIAKKATKRRD